MGQLSHFFFAVSLPDRTKEILKSHRDELREFLPFSRWVHEQDYHITLAFLGYAEKEKLDSAKEKVKQKISDLNTFSLSIDSLGFFGREEAPRIFWAGVRDEPKLHILRSRVFTACEKAGFPLEKRPFHPHITIARKWNGEFPFSLTNERVEKVFSSPASFSASEIILYKTHLEKSPKYEAISSFKLKKNDFQ